MWLSLKGFCSIHDCHLHSWVGFYHKLNGHVDPRYEFLVSKLLEDRETLDNRVPITVPVLSRILIALPHISFSRFEELLFRAAMLYAFLGLMRVGELTADSAKRVQDSVLQFSDVTFSPNALRNFLTIRPKVPGVLFCHYGDNPLTRYQFNSVLKKALVFFGLGEQCI